MLNRQKASALSLLKEVIQTYQSEYSYVTGSWRGLENKAQATLAIDGALNAIIGGIILNPTLVAPVWAEILTIVVIMLLTVSIFCCVLVLVKRSVINPPTGDIVAGMTRDLISLQDISYERKFRFYQDMFSIWQACLASHRKINDYKAKYLFVAQLSLLGALLFSTFTIAGIAVFS